ncbi:hypothetical protein LDVICp079 [lymphocystis disease virus-China]|uniref:Uncharacterized protein n=1 Tax=lymphocystis disease virus-China TaxID=256729 RepID=Q678D2_9VIRU|nr:hypothetical protein LDVICp079 [lymphocystis disease virus-China]AAU10924.1 hypothetical protein [lymphocystis disease virus-China]
MGIISLVSLPAQYKSLAQKVSLPVKFFKIPALIRSSLSGSSMTTHRTPPPVRASSGLA